MKLKSPSARSQEVSYPARVPERKEAGAPPFIHVYICKPKHKNMTLHTTIQKHMSACRFQRHHTLHISIIEAEMEKKGTLLGKGLFNKLYQLTGDGR